MAASSLPSAILQKLFALDPNGVNLSIELVRIRQLEEMQLEELKKMNDLLLILVQARK